MTTDAIAPRTRRVDETVARGERESRIPQQALHALQPLRQRSEVGHDQPDGAAEDLRRAGRQVELRFADVDPHVVHTRHEIGVARESEAGDVVDRGEALVRHRHVHVLELDDVADVFRGAIEACVHAAP